MRKYIYRELSDIRDKVERLIPSEDGDHEFYDALMSGEKFETLIEANPLGVWQMETTPPLWRAQDDFGSRLTHECKRQHVCRVTRQLALDEHHAEKQALTATDLPEGIRLWHATQRAQGLLFHARHDLVDLFKDSRREIPSDDDLLGGAVTLLVTPKRTLGFRDGMKMLSPRSPYLTKLCAEYARMACWLYGLDIREFSSLAQMSITRHPSLPTSIALLPSGGGFYDSGPALSVLVGRVDVAHDFKPLLIVDDKPNALRVAVPEGVLLALDGNIRVAYGRGYASLQPRGKNEAAFFTIDFALDCMRHTQLLGKIPPTGWLVMYTPVVSQHVVERRPVKKQGLSSTASALICPIRSLLQSIRSRLQDRESFILSRPYQSLLGERSSSSKSTMDE